MNPTTTTTTTAQLLSSFIGATRADLDSPVTSNFGSRISDYRQRIDDIATQLDTDRIDIERLRKGAADLHSAIGTLRAAECTFADICKSVAEKWSSRAEHDVQSETAAGLLKLSMLSTENAQLLAAQSRSVHNHLVHPFDVLLATAPNEMLKKSVDKTAKEYETKFVKVERDTRTQAKISGYTRGQLTHSELSEYLGKERCAVQYELCKFLLAVDGIEDRKGPQLLRHLIDYLQSQEIYFEDGLRTTRLFHQDLEQLSNRVPDLKEKKHQERVGLFELKERLEQTYKRSSKTRLGNGSAGGDVEAVASVPLSSKTLHDRRSHSPQLTCSGYLWKKSTKALHKQWQKRRCRIENGHLLLSHSDESKLPVQIDLLHVDCKPSIDDSRSFDLFCRDRTYHLQAENENDLQRWIGALRYEIDAAKCRIFDPHRPFENQSDSANIDWPDRIRCASAVRQLPGNHRCADCDSDKDISWLSTNLGVLVCISCSGSHRELGVHVSRIQSLDLDVISPTEFLIALDTGNALINRVYEADIALATANKPLPTSSRLERNRYISDKYKDRRYIGRHSSPNIKSLLNAAIASSNIEQLLLLIVHHRLDSTTNLDESLFNQLVQCNDLSMLELIVQYRIGSASTISNALIECVHRNRIDHLAILLRSKTVVDIRLQSILDVAIKLENTQAAHMIRAAIINDRTALDRIRIPPHLLISASSPSSSSTVDNGSPISRRSSTNRPNIVASCSQANRAALLPPRPASTRSQPPPLPTTPKPKLLYHRSASEYDETMHRIEALSKSFDADLVTSRTLPTSSKRVIVNSSNGVVDEQTLPSLLQQPPMPAPRRLLSTTSHQQQQQQIIDEPPPPQQPSIQYCRAIYDCVADNSDELSFRLGDRIVITKSNVDGEDDTWMEGYVMHNAQHRGVFPVSFVTFD